MFQLLQHVPNHPGENAKTRFCVQRSPVILQSRFLKRRGYNGITASHWVTQIQEFGQRILKFPSK